jgi:hypothetical protein
VDIRRRTTPTGGAGKSRCGAVTAVTKDDGGVEPVEDLEDAVAAVIADELCAQLHVRRRPGEIAGLVADELLRAFDIRPRGALADPAVPDDWPVIRHVNVDRTDQAHVELATLPAVTHPAVHAFDLPGGGRVSVLVQPDGSVSEILLQPASRLLPQDAREERPRPASAADQ